LLENAGAVVLEPIGAAPKASAAGHIPLPKLIPGAKTRQMACVVIAKPFDLFPPSPPPD
jgi:hypothetical protein